MVSVINFRVNKLLLILEVSEQKIHLLIHEVCVFIDAKSVSEAVVFHHHLGLHVASLLVA